MTDRRVFECGLRILLGVADALGTVACAHREDTPAMTEGPAPKDCGKKGHPDCPLQAWMKSTLQTYLKDEDGEHLAASLEQLAAHEPPGYSGWATAAKDAATRARAGDFSAVKDRCKSCHDEYRSSFRAELRTARLF